MTESIFIGVDLGGTSVRAGRFADENHVPEAKTKLPTLAAKGTEAVLGRLEQAIRAVAPPDLQRVAAIGLIAPGLVDPHTGTVITAPNLPGWENVPLTRIMTERLGRPIYIGNDANLAALGEWKFGAGRGYRDVLYLTISTGIGAGVISGGRLVLGARGLATEVGHILAVPDGPLCGCGQRGHLEAVASGTAIARTARARLKAGDGEHSRLWELCAGDLEQVTGAMVGEAAQAGDAFALKLIADAARFLGRTLASLMHLFNPSIVIFGGGVSMLGEILLEPLRAAMREHAMNEHYWRSCPIVPAALGDDAGLIGAAALAMEETRARALDAGRDRA